MEKAVLDYVTSLELGEIQSHENLESESYKGHMRMLFV
jgi:hypothetical protein